MVITPSRSFASESNWSVKKNIIDLSRKLEIHRVDRSEDMNVEIAKNGKVVFKHINVTV